MSKAPWSFARSSYHNRLIKKQQNQLKELIASVGQETTQSKLQRNWNEQQQQHFKLSNQLFAVLNKINANIQNMIKLHAQP